MERGLLSDPKLAAFYDKAVWMYLFQDFSESESDRAAQRIAIRFGITAWPQHFLVDPYSLEILADTGRSLASFSAAVQGASVQKRQGGITPEDLAVRDAAAKRLEGTVSTASAREGLQHEDAVVRYRALEYLRKQDPAAIASAAVGLLAQPHDQTRFAVCQVLAETGASERTATALEALVEKPSDSRNPNMLRAYAVQALAKCGDAGSIEIVAPHATSGLYFNGLTIASVECLLTIATRDKKAEKPVVGHLCAAFPTPKADAEEREVRACMRLAHRVHDALEELTGKRVSFPDTYDTDTRTALMTAWSSESKRLR